MAQGVLTRTRRARTNIAGWLLVVFAALVAVFFLFPVAWAMLTSVKPPGEAVSSPTSLPSRISLDNYEKIATYGIGIWGYLWNTIFVSGISVVGTVFLSTLAGYGFARFDFPGKNVVFVLVLATFMIPFQAILVPLFLVLNRVGLTNSLVGLALVFITFQLPFGIFMMRNSFAGLPRELEDAAMVDGCTSWGALFRVLLPLVVPGMATVLIFTFLNSWNEFLAALIFLQDQEKFTLPILLLSAQSGEMGSIDWGALQAGVTVTAVPTIVVFLALQRYYISGLVSGALKA
jgi:multiple sugar transport system permease protein